MLNVLLFLLGLVTGSAIIFGLFYLGVCITENCTAHADYWEKEETDDEPSR